MSHLVYLTPGALPQPDFPVINLVEYQQFLNSSSAVISCMLELHKGKPFPREQMLPMLKDFIALGCSIINQVACSIKLNPEHLFVIQNKLGAILARCGPDDILRRFMQITDRYCNYAVNGDVFENFSDRTAFEDMILRVATLIVEALNIFQIKYEMRKDLT